jgi:hypothetical protein
MEAGVNVNPAVTPVEGAQGRSKAALIDSGAVAIDPPAHDDERMGKEVVCRFE